MFEIHMYIHVSYASFYTCAFFFCTIYGTSHFPHLYISMCAVFLFRTFYVVFILHTFPIHRSIDPIDFVRLVFVFSSLLVFFRGWLSRRKADPQSLFYNGRKGYPKHYFVCWCPWGMWFRWYRLSFFQLRKRTVHPLEHCTHCQSRYMDSLA